MVAIDHNKSQYKHSNFLQYSKKSWERWCLRNGVDFHCITEHDERYGYPIWNKLNVIDDMVRGAVTRRIDERITRLVEDRNVWNN